MSQAARWHKVRATHWNRAAEGRASAALLLAAHELRTAAEVRQDQLSTAALAA